LAEITEFNQYRSLVERAPCDDANGNPLPGFSDPSLCTGANSPNPNYVSTLAPYDLTR